MLFHLVLALVLSAPTPAQAGCRELFTSLVQSISGQSRLEEPFRKYFEDGDPQGWKKALDEIVDQGGGKTSLGGNDASTYSVMLPDGSSVVTKEFPSADLRDHVKTIQQLERWSAEGKGPKILGVSLLPGLKGSERQLFLVMEDLVAARNDLGKKIVAGSGREARLLRGEPEPARRWLMERMLSLLETHSDPHPMNVIFRVTQLRPEAVLPREGTYFQEGSRIYQAFLVDPSGVEGNPEHPIYNTEIGQTPEPLLQYNREWKRRYFEKAMGLIGG